MKVLKYDSETLGDRNLMYAYLSGPMRGLPELNFPAFAAVQDALEWWEFGVTNPANLGSPDDSIADCVERDVKAIRNLDPASSCVVLLHGWEHSIGSRAEVALAVWLEIPLLPVPGATDPRSVFPASEAEHSVAAARVFSGGATRDTADGKPDFSGFLSPIVLRRFGAYMLKHQIGPGGTRRDADNWKAGMPQKVYLASLLRHVIDVWGGVGGDDLDGPLDEESLEDALCAVLFNASGLLRERLLDRDVEEA